MAIVQNVDVLPAALWPQGDIRDPLGIWGFRQGITGDATGGSTKVIVGAPAGLAAAYLYTCYSVNIAELSGTAVANNIKVRLLANWPNIDTIPGVQGYSSLRFGGLQGIGGFTSPINGLTEVILGPNDRFILLFDPRPSAGRLDIVELELNSNVNTETWSFEGYGYFWDRSVLNAPGGPRHPGST